MRPIMLTSQRSQYLSHGHIFTVSGSGFGTRPDYNAGNYTWQGHRHMHLLWLDFANGFPPDGSSQATFQSDTYLKGAFPAASRTTGFFAFNANPVSDAGVAIQNGGPSKSGKYVKKTSGGFAEGGYIQINKTNLTPADGITIFKAALAADAKIFRQWRVDAGGDWYHGTGGAFLEFEPWPYDSTAFNSLVEDNVFRRHELVLSLANGCTLRINSQQQSFTGYIGGVPNVVTSLPLITSAQNGKDIYCTWPNSTDTGSISFADIYYDQIATRVELWSDSVGTVREVQPLSSWSDGSIVIICNQGELPTGSVKIKVIAATNTVIATQDAVLQ